MTIVRRNPLRTVNHLLLIAIFAINLYIIAAPIWPQVTFWWRSHHSQKAEQLQQALRPSTAPNNNDTQAQGNQLIIPAMQLQQATVEGPEKDWFNLLKEGIWRWPASSTPDKGGNTVFLAHRFSYTGPHGAFYFLDKLKMGDEIGVHWDNKTYVYTVTSMREVPPTEVSIQDNTKDARLTLFTCTPLWHPVNRLVVVAELKETP